MSFTNRMIIPAANGLTMLSVPLRGGRENRRPLNEVGIDNSQRWQTRHWRTITSAYRRSPWFEYYEDELESFYSRRFDGLADWNLALYKWTIDKLKVDQQITLLEGLPAEGIYIGLAAEPRPSQFQGDEFIRDLPSYNQVFRDRIGFQPNMSILDLLCNEGPAAKSLLA